MPFVDIELVFHRDSKKAMKSAMKTKGVPRVTVKAMMGLYHEPKIKFRVGSE